MTMLEREKLPNKEKTRFTNPKYTYILQFSYISNVTTEFPRELLLQYNYGETVHSFQIVVFKPNTNFNW